MAYLRENLEATAVSGSLVVVAQTKQIPQLQELVETACRGSSQMQEMLLKKAREMGKPYLAFETVRKERACELVGRPVAVISNGKSVELSPTGFEPYFIEETPASEKQRQEQAQSIVTQIADLGVTMLEKIREWDSKSRTAMFKTLKGEEYSLYWLRVLDGMSPFARLRARGLKSIRRRTVGAYQEFQADTYGRVAELPHITYALDETPATQTVTLKLRNDPRFNYREVSITPKQLDGFELMTDIGRIGHPLIRSALAVAYELPSKSANVPVTVWPTGLWQERMTLSRIGRGAGQPVVLYDATNIAYKDDKRGWQA